MARQKGDPDRRGMGAESDFIAEQFVPSEHYKAQQMAMAQKLIEAGLDSEEVAKMFLVTLDIPSAEKPEDP